MSNFTPAALRGALPADIDPETDLDLSRLELFVRSALRGQSAEVIDQVMEAFGSEVPIEWTPFDAAGYTQAILAGNPLVRVHWSTLDPDVPLDWLDMNKAF